MKLVTSRAELRQHWRPLGIALCHRHINARYARFSLIVVFVVMGPMLPHVERDCDSIGAMMQFANVMVVQ